MAKKATLITLFMLMLSTGAIAHGISSPLGSLGPVGPFDDNRVIEIFALPGWFVGCGAGAVTGTAVGIVAAPVAWVVSGLEKDVLLFSPVVGAIGGMVSGNFLGQCMTAGPPRLIQYMAWDWWH